jgi:hypothetical protein
MEACSSAHCVSRTLRGLGFEPRIMPPKYTRPFLKGQKNDYNDAKAIAEAALRPNIRCVRKKTQDQLDLQALHRLPSTRARKNWCPEGRCNCSSVPFLLWIRASLISGPLNIVGEGAYWNHCRWY